MSISSSQFGMLSAIVLLTIFSMDTFGLYLFFFSAQDLQVWSFNEIADFLRIPS
jgi:hypothetical protein